MNLVQLTICKLSSLLQMVSKNGMCYCSHFLLKLGCGLKLIALYACFRIHNFCEPRETILTQPSHATNKRLP